MSTSWSFNSSSFLELNEITCKIIAFKSEGIDFLKPDE